MKKSTITAITIVVLVVFHVAYSMFGWIGALSVLLVAILFSSVMGAVYWRGLRKLHATQKGLPPEWRDAVNVACGLDAKVRRDLATLEREERASRHSECSRTGTEAPR